MKVTTNTVDIEAKAIPSVDMEQCRLYRCKSFSEDYISMRYDNYVASFAVSDNGLSPFIIQHVDDDGDGYIPVERGFSLTVTQED